jgi:6-phosphogluconolactonase
VDGAAVPAGTPYVYVSGANETQIYTIDLQSGALTPRMTVAAGAGYMAWDPMKKYMYAGSGAQVIAYAIDGRTGALTRINAAAVAMGGTTASGVTHIFVHPTGRWVLTAHFTSGHAAILPVGANGGVSPPTDIQRPAAEAHYIMTDKAGRYAFVPCRSGNLVGQYVVDATNGRLMPNNPPSMPADRAGAGPRHMDFHPTEKWAYVINEQNGTTTSYNYDTGTGRLSAPETVSAVPAMVTETASAHIVVHPTGKFVYASNRQHNSIVVYAVNATTGRLTTVEHNQGDNLIRTPRDFTLDPSGRFVLVANQATRTVLVFRIDQETGKLTRVGNPVTAPQSAAYVGVVALP